jgi:FkbM family methyltransferase
MLGRNFTRLIKAPFEYRNYISLWKASTIYQDPLTDFVNGYIRQQGTFPKTVKLKTPTGITEIEILNSLDYFTINEIFCWGIYYADDTPKVFLDLGSNIGCSELYFLSRNKSNILYGFEPVPHLYSQLNKNVNSCKDRVHNQNVAISDVDGEVSMGIEDSGRYGGIGVVTGKNITVQSRNINAILQEILAKHEFIDIVKIDIEGVEQTVINAIDKEYLKRIKSIYVEAGDEFIYPDNLKDCFKAIKHRGICKFVNNTTFA